MRFLCFVELMGIIGLILIYMDISELVVALGTRGVKSRKNRECK